MNTITIDQLTTRTDLELRVLFGLCNRILHSAPPLSREWSLANRTAHHILKVRQSRFRLPTL